MSDRVAISQTLRFEVFKRDEFKCQYCGSHPPDVILEIDHIIPVSDDGETIEENLITACFNCNRGKGVRSLTAVPKSLKDKASEIQEREAQILGYREVMQVTIDRIEQDAWHVLSILIPESIEKGTRKAWYQSVKNFLRRLPLHEVLEAAEIANTKFPWSSAHTFKYFCGICWNKIKRSEK
jgi:hypothetical protein